METDTPTAGTETPAGTEPVVDVTPSIDTGIDAPTGEVETTDTGQGIDTLPEWAQKELRSARDEAASRRVALKNFEVFERFAEEDRGVLLDLLGQLADPDTRSTGAQSMLAIAQALLGDPDDAGTDTPGGDDPDRPLTKAELDRYIEEREKAKAQEQADKEALAALDTKATELGYTPGTRNYMALLWEAKHNHGYDLDAAHKALEAEKQQVIDNFISEKSKDAERTPAAGSGAGSPPSNEERPKDWGKAGASTYARLDALFGSD